VTPRRGGALLIVALLLLPGTAFAQPAETVEYYGQDVIGSIRIVFSPAGAVLARQDYEPFGRPLFTAAALPREGFGAQEPDDETVQSYFHARMFQQRTGRFTRVDPIFVALFEPQRWVALQKSESSSVQMKVLIAAMFAVAAAIAGIQMFSLDGILGIVAPLGFSEDTRYAPGYSTAAFMAVHRGDAERRVVELLGEPLTTAYLYASGPCQIVWISLGTASDSFPETCVVKRREAMTVVRASLGMPTQQVWLYSDSPSDKSYRERVIYIQDGTVIRVRTGFYVD
jgi:hypothetical protein